MSAESSRALGTRRARAGPSRRHVNRLRRGLAPQRNVTLPQFQYCINIYSISFFYKDQSGSYSGLHFARSAVARKIDNSPYHGVLRLYLRRKRRKQSMDRFVQWAKTLAPQADLDDPLVPMCEPWVCLKTTCPAAPTSRRSPVRWDGLQSHATGWQRPTCVAKLAANHQLYC